MLIIIFLQPFCIQGDLAKEEDTIKVVDETIKHYGRLDILVRTGPEFIKHFFMFNSTAHEIYPACKC